MVDRSAVQQKIGNIRIDIQEELKTVGNDSFKRALLSMAYSELQQVGATLLYNVDYSKVK